MNSVGCASKLHAQRQELEPVVLTRVSELLCTSLALETAQLRGWESFTQHLPSVVRRGQSWGCPHAAGSPAPSRFCPSVLVLCPEIGGTKGRMGTSHGSINKPERQLSPQPSGLQQLLCSSTVALVWARREIGSVMGLGCEVQLQLLQEELRKQDMGCCVGQGGEVQNFLTENTLPGLFVWECSFCGIKA